MNGGNRKKKLISVWVGNPIRIGIAIRIRNQGMIEIGDMRYRRFFIWVNFGSNLNHCVGGNWHLSDIQRAVAPFLF